MLDGLKARLEKLLADQTAPGDPRQHAAILHGAVVDARVAVGTMRDALVTTEGQLTRERQQLSDAERRGQLAAQIPDPETMQIAEQFATRHRERIGILERKVGVQQEELRLAESDLAQMTEEWRKAKSGGAAGTTPNQQAAWRDIEEAGGVRPDTDMEGELLKHQLKHTQLDAAVKAQLEHLKKKMGKE